MFSAAAGIEWNRRPSNAGTPTRVVQRVGLRSGSHSSRDPEVFRQRRLDLDSLAAERMRERKPFRMQELALQPELARASVDGIAGDGQPDRVQVHPDLVRAAGLELHVEKRVPWKELDDLEVRDRLTRRVRVERVAHRVAPVSPDRCLDPAGPRARAADDEREIVPLELPFADEILQTR